MPEPMSGCWLWLGHIHRLGYGRMRVGKRMRQAHEVSYELFLGTVPAGMELDHLCKNRACVNPEHLEPVSHYENIMRGNGFGAINARKTHCINGHPFNAKNTYLWKNKMRQCRVCNAINVARGKNKKVEK